MLIQRIQTLAEKDGHIYTNHPRRLAVMLLGDWVFSHDARSTKSAVDFVLDGAGIRRPLTNKRRKYTMLPEDSLVLPPGCGRKELIEKCFETLREKPKRDYVYENSQVLIANASHSDVDIFWTHEISRATSAEILYWLQCGQSLGALSRCDLSLLDSLAAQHTLKAEHYEVILNAGRSSFIESVEGRCADVVTAMLNGTNAYRRRASDILSVLGRAIDPFLYEIAFREAGPVPLNNILRQHYLPQDLEVTHANYPTSEVLDKCTQLISVHHQEIQKPAMDWVRSLEPWGAVVETARSLWGEQWLVCRLANSAAGIHSPQATCKNWPDLLDHSKTLCERVRYARLRAGNPTYWSQQFEEARSSLDKVLVALVFCSWSSVGTAVKLADRAGVFLDSLLPREWRRVANGVQAMTYWVRPKRTLGTMADLPAKMSNRLVTALGRNLPSDDASAMYLKYLSDYDGDDLAILSFCARTAMQLSSGEPMRWDHALALIEKMYKHGVIEDVHFLNEQRYLYHSQGRDMFPLEIAKWVGEYSEKFPRNLVFAAAERCQVDLEKSLKPVGAIAVEEKWFERE